MSVYEFISHRVARLYPLHLFSLLVFCLVICFFGKFPSVQLDQLMFTLFQHLTLSHNIGFNPKGSFFNYPSWSISVEFWINIVFIFFITKATRSATLFLVSLVGLIIIYNNTGHLNTFTEHYYGLLNSGMVRGFASFFLGILSYRIYLHFTQSSAPLAGKSTLKITLLEAVFIALVLVIALVRPQKQSALDFVAPFVFMLLIPVFSLDVGRISKLFFHFRYLGTISYSIYLNQITVLMVSEYLLKPFDLPGYLEYLVFLSALLCYSHVTYQYVEKPSRTFVRRLLSLKR